MSEPTGKITSRREFLKDTGRIAAASALAGAAIPYVHAAENNTIQVALVGCGGRGSGAADNACPPRAARSLVAMGDVFERKLNNSYENLKNALPASSMCPRTANSLALTLTRRQWIV